MLAARSVKRLPSLDRRWANLWTALLSLSPFQDRWGPVLRHEHGAVDFVAEGVFVLVSKQVGNGTSQSFDGDAGWKVELEDPEGDLAHGNLGLRIDGARDHGEAPIRIGEAGVSCACGGVRN